MRKVLSLLVLIYIHVLPVVADNWVKSFGNNDGNVQIKGVVADSENNAIIVGTFTSAQLEIDANISLQNQGIYDVFIVKYNPAGEVVWAISFGGNMEEQVGDICIDDENNIYITGNFRSSTLIIGNNTFSTSWPDNIYVAKFYSEGTLAWIKQSTKATKEVIGSGISIDASQYIHVSAYTRSQELKFGSTEFSLSSINYKGFYASFDKEGNAVSGAYLADEGEDQYLLNDIAADGDGNIYLAGTKIIHTEPDPITWNEYKNVFFIQKTDASGNVAWTMEDTAMYEAKKILLDDEKLIFLGNRLEYRAIFNGGTIDTTSVFKVGTLEPGGQMQWLNAYTGALAYDLFANDTSILVAGGLLKDQLDFGDFSIRRNADSSSNCPIYQDIFHLEINMSGDVKKAESISGSLEDIPGSIYLAKNGDLYYSGIYESFTLQLEGNEIYNTNPLNTFQHVSGTYYNRDIYSFLARRSLGSTGIGNGRNAKNDFSLYPNPAQGWVRIEVRNSHVPLAIRIYDAGGRLVHSEQLEDDRSNIDLSGLKKGIYLMRLSGSQGEGGKILVIEN